MIIFSAILLAAATAGAPGVAQMENETRKEPVKVVALERMFMD
jgi:hypothetical protein